MQNFLLCDIKKGERLLIKKLETKGPLRKRLLDIGFIPETEVECVRTSPFGDPKAYSVRGTIIALRKKDASFILGVKI